MVGSECGSPSDFPRSRLGLESRAIRGGIGFVGKEDARPSVPGNERSEGPAFLRSGPPLRYGPGTQLRFSDKAWSYRFAKAAWMVSATVRNALIRA